MTITLRRNLVLAFTLMLVSLSLILLDARGAIDGPKSLLTSGVSPISEALTRAGNKARGIGDRSDSELQQQLEQVSAERDALLAERAELIERASEADQLRELLGFQQSRPDLHLLQADIVSRDPQSREKFLVINRGSNHGIQVGMAVVSPHYLVGQVTSVEPNRARVLLVIDAAFQTGALLQHARHEGIIYGRWQAGGRVTMRHLPLETEIIDGELVVTSGRTELVPPGLVIGVILSETSDQPRNETELEVLPLADFDELSVVTVVIGAEDTEE
ncbi:MAG TPA: rod shape-determining protein MreC [Thermomicrobiales bacterium]|nr:rod shape-determining protein MreC [Thermomicrobiales bacterium]